MATAVRDVPGRLAGVYVCLRVAGWVTTFILLLAYDYIRSITILMILLCLLVSCIIGIIIKSLRPPAKTYSNHILRIRKFAIVARFSQHLLL